MPFTLLVALLAAPSVLFNLTFLSPAIAAAVSLALLAGAWLTSRDRHQAQRLPQDAALLAVCLTLGTGLVLLGGEGRLVYATDDWIIRDAVLFDLVREPWPVGYRREGMDWILRAPLGLYMVPAALGKLGGIHAAVAALVVQNALIAGLVLYGFARAFPGKVRAVVLATFLLWGSLDIIPFALDLMKGAAPDPQLDLVHSYGGMKYLAPLTQFFWAPHHSIAGWAFTAGYLTWRDGRLGAAGLTGLTALTFFWSPLAGAGELPFLALALWGDLRAGKLRLASLAGAATLTGLGCLPAIFYMAMASGSVSRTWAFLKPEFILNYPMFLALHLGPALLFLWLGMRRRGEPVAARVRLEWAVIVAVLLACPLLMVNFTNDFTLRASIPALALLSLAVGRELARCLKEGFGERRFILPVLALSALVPLSELARVTFLPADPMRSCNLIDAWDTGPWRAYPLDAYLAPSKAFEAQSWLWRPTASMVTAQGRLCPLEPPGM